MTAEVFASQIHPKHLLQVLALGIAVGFFIVVLDQFVISRVEAAVGLVPSAA